MRPDVSFQTAFVNCVHSCLPRNPADQKPSLNFSILGYDVSLIDNKETKKSYCIKVSHPSQETYYFATDSRVSIERWIEVLSLAATGRLDVIAPYPPYFCAEQSGDELKSRSRESLLSSEVRFTLNVIFLQYIVLYTFPVLLESVLCQVI